MNTCSEILAKKLAACYFLHANEDVADQEYDIAMSLAANEEFEKVIDVDEKFSLSIDNCEAMQNLIASLATASDMFFGIYGEYIKRGLLFKILNGKLSDFNELNITECGTIGYNISQIWSVKNEQFEFDPGQLAWKSKSSQLVLQPDQETGLPKQVIQTL